MDVSNVFSTLPKVIGFLLLALSCGATLILAQSVASGTIEGVVADSTGGVVSNAMVMIRNVLSGYQQTTATDSSGAFRFTNLPFNNYRIEVSVQGFALSQQDVNIRTNVPASVKVVMNLAAIAQESALKLPGKFLKKSPMPTARWTS
jgi:hypothetical protein